MVGLLPGASRTVVFGQGGYPERSDEPFATSALPLADSLAITIGGQ